MPKYGIFDPKKRYQPKTVAEAMEKDFVDVGGNGDCGFKTIAASIIDQENRRVLNKILPHYQKCFPDQPVFSAEDLIKIGLKSPKDLAVLLRDLAFALRQIAVIEMCANIELYPGAFVENHENTSPEKMRKPTTWIDEDAIKALSRYLDYEINIELSMTNHEIYLVRHSASTQQHDQINDSKATLRLHNGHYTAKLKQKIRFQKAKDIDPGPLMATIPNYQDPSMEEIKQRIAIADQKLILDFERTRKRLESLVFDGQLTKDDLLNIYIKARGDSEYLRGRVKYIKTEHGDQDFFKQALKRVENREYEISSLEQDFNEVIINEAIHAISRAASVGLIDENKLYSEIDNLPLPRRPALG